MTDEQAKKILQQSIIRTSDDFTDALMDRIEVEKAISDTVVWPFKFVLSAIAGLVLAMSYGLHNFVPFEMVIPKTLVFVAALLGGLFAINHILRLKEEYHGQKKRGKQLIA